MVAYEFYRRDPIKGYELLGVLPERRRNLQRITQKSVMAWGDTVFGNTKDIYFIQVTINENTGMIFGPTLALITYR